MAAAEKALDRVRRLLADNHERLRAIARKLCRDGAEADDLVQDACERALRHVANEPDRELSDGWLVTVMHHAFIDRCRKAKRYATTPIENLPIAQPEPEAAAVWETISPSEVTAAIANLPDDFRAVYELFAAGASYVEIAAKLKIPKATVGTRIARARRKLRTALLGGIGEGEA